MPQAKLTQADLKKREDRAREWLDFRKAYLFTQLNLAESVGISRRTVQAVEAARVTPQMSTLRKFKDLKKEWSRRKAA